MKNRHTSNVASFTDAWIETSALYNGSFLNSSHLLQMRGLKPFARVLTAYNVLSHLLQMRGLKQEVPLRYFALQCRIFYRCVD